MQATQRCASVFVLFPWLASQRAGCSGRRGVSYGDCAVLVALFCNVQRMHRGGVLIRPAVGNASFAFQHSTSHHVIPLAVLQYHDHLPPSPPVLGLNQSKLQQQPPTHTTHFSLSSPLHCSQKTAAQISRDLRKTSQQAAWQSNAATYPGMEGSSESATHPVSRCAHTYACITTPRQGAQHVLLLMLTPRHHRITSSLTTHRHSWGPEPVRLNCVKCRQPSRSTTQW